MAKDLTEGRPLKLILSFALPLFLGNLFQQLYNIVDTAVVGRFLGTQALGAVGASSSVQFLVLGFCIGICCGFAIPVAQRFGAKDYDRMREYIFNSAILCVGFAAVLTVVCSLLCPNILRMLSAPEEIFEDANAYLLILFMGMPFTILYNILAAILRAVGDSRTPFLFLVISTVLNIIMDLLFVIVFEWGVAGAAIATIAAQAVSGMLCFAYIWRNVPLLHIPKRCRKADTKLLGSLTVMGVPMGLQYSITAIGSMVMQSANNSLGTVYVSGYTAGFRIKQMLMCPFDALATGVATFAGQNLGAGKLDRIKQGIRQGVLVGMAYGAVIGVVMWLFGRNMASLLVSGEDTAPVLDAAGRYIRCMGVLFWTLGILNVCRMTVQGLGYSGRAVFSGVVEMIGRVVMSSFTGALGFWAICFSDQSAWILASIYISITTLVLLKKLDRAAAAPKGHN